MKLRYDEIKRMEGVEKNGKSKKEFSKFKNDILAGVGAIALTISGMVTALNCGANEEKPPAYVAPVDVSSTKDAGADVEVSKVCSSVNVERQITRKEGESFLISLNDGSKYMADISEIDASSVSMWIYNGEGERQVFVTLKNGESRDFTINNIELNITVCSIRPDREVKSEANAAEKTEYMATLETTKGQLEVPSADAGQSDVSGDADLDAGVEQEDAVEPVEDAGMEDVVADAEEDAGVEQEDVGAESLEDAGVEDAVVEPVEDAGMEDAVELVEDAATEDVVADAEEDAGVEQEDVGAESLEDAGVEDAVVEPVEDAGTEDAVELVEDVGTEDAATGDAVADATTDVIDQDVVTDGESLDAKQDAGQDAGMVCEKKSDCKDTSKDYQLFNNNGIVVTETFSQKVCTITNTDCSVENLEDPIYLRLSKSLTPDEQAIFCKQMVDGYLGLTTKYTTSDRVSGKLLQYNAAAKRNDALYTDSNGNAVTVVSVTVTNGINFVWVKYLNKMYQVSSSNCEPTNIGGSLYVKVYEGGNAVDGVPVAVAENVTKFVNNAEVIFNGKNYDVQINTEQGQPNNLTGMTLTPKK